MKPASSRLSASRAAIFLMLALGAVASLAMLMVTLAMTVHATRGVLAGTAASSSPGEATSGLATGPPAAKAAVANASSPASSSSPDSAVGALEAMSTAVTAMASAVASKPAPAPESDGTKDAVANAMTAVGTAIAAVALILSVGTTWFAQRLKEVDKMMVELDRMHGVYRAHIDRISDREATATLLIPAREALVSWIDARSSTVDRFRLHWDITSLAEMLMSDSAERRFNAYGRLLYWLDDTSLAELAAVSEYAEACHRLHGGRADTIGVWCRLFDPVERAAHTAKAIAPQQF